MGGARVSDSTCERSSKGNGEAYEIYLQMPTCIHGGVGRRALKHEYGRRQMRFFGSAHLAVNEGWMDRGFLFLSTYGTRETKGIGQNK